MRQRRPLFVHYSAEEDTQKENSVPTFNVSTETLKVGNNYQSKLLAGTKICGTVCYLCTTSIFVIIIIKCVFSFWQDIMSDAIEPIPEEEVLALFLAKNDDQDAKGVSEDGESEAEAGELQAEEGELIDEVRNPIVFNSLYDWWLKSWWSNEVNGMRSILEINYTFKDVE